METNKENKMLLILLSIFVIAVFAYTYNRFYIQKDYIVEQHVSCDPETENCFVWQCDPAVEECSENEEENVDYYKLIEKHAASIPECSGEDCEELTCEVGEEDCVITLCTPADAELEGVECSNDLMEEGTEETEEAEGAADEEASEEAPEAQESDVLES